MTAVLIWFVAIYVVLLGLIMVLGFFLQVRKERNYLQGEAFIDLAELVVLIPFRDEALRIGPLLDSIRNASVLPARLVFIDDHSTDQTQNLIRSKLEGIAYSIIELPTGVTGKKRALRYATDLTDSTYLLTLDADVVLSPTYFEKLSKLSPADMYVLSVRMPAQKWYAYFFEMDFLLVNAANAGLSGLLRPIMASGANLLYKRSAFQEVDNVDTHIHAASGDDTYLLRDFRQHHKQVRLVSSPDLSVTTATPSTLKEFMDQRLRWIGKTQDIKDHLSTGLALIQTVFTLLFLSLFVYFGCWGEVDVFLVLFLIKTIIDQCVFLPYFLKVRRFSVWFLIPLYEVVFPFYTLALFILMYTYQPKWKGRTIYTKGHPK